MRLALALCLLAAPALADEVWTSEFGDIIYERDTADYKAVLSVPAIALNGMTAANARGQVMIYNLTNNVSDRYGIFEGYWTAPGEPTCDTALMPPGSKASWSWGRVQVIFDRPEFPSGFTMLIGTCFWDPAYSLRAEAFAG